ncbi:O-antigen ligase family protein [Phragmitibacter flavus]|uniref:O-antigen ligase family protein n=1 Tax=Phragmitibacter flavus TaxID=2576071 RepID=UPI00140DA080|nr:O-antigen ligase family protein [Phragmitibacter flavus]
MNIIRPVMLIWVALLLFGDMRSRTPLRGILKTPHDWLVLAYFLYVVFTAPAGVSVFSGFFPLVVFYGLTVQSLSSWDKVLGYLKWWNWMLLALALMGVLSLYGLDITGGKPITDSMQGRLSLGTWMHNNPNALGHSVVAAIPLSYVLWFWRGSLFQRAVMFPAFMILAGMCAWETQSKGSYVVGGMLTVLIFVIGRPKFVQIGAIAMAAVLGVGALSFLPRMEQMGNLRADEGVLGRLMAWEQARQATKDHATGVGWKQFIAFIPWVAEGNRPVIVAKATHSSYVQVAADLGIYGLFLYLAAQLVALRTLLVLRPRDEEQERCRRALILLIAANMISGWMINRQYHTEYFLMIAVAAAIHRLTVAEELTKAEEAKAEAARLEEAKFLDKAPVAQLTPVLIFQASGPGLVKSDSVPQIKKFWNRFGWLDLMVAGSATWLTIWIWDYIMANL